MESDLYPPIEKLFRRKGYFTISARKKRPGEVAHSPFGVNVHGKTMKVDVVTFDWIDEWEIDTFAIEVKQGRTWEGVGQALGQATAYQRLFPKVYIASEATEDSLKHVESLLRQLGLGYITVNTEVAEEIFPPSQNIRFNKKDFNQQVRTKAMALLAYKDVFGDDDIQFGRADRPGEIWVSDKGIRTCNIFLHLNFKEASIGLNIEEKKAVKDVFSSVEIDELYNLISKLNPKYEVFLSKFIGPKIHGKTEGVEQINVASITPKVLEDIIAKIKELNWLVDLQIRKRIIINESQNLSKQNIIHEVKTTAQELSSLYTLFKNFLGK